jgi:hypothetical protein
VTDTSAVVIGQPSFFSDLGAAIREVPLEDWKTTCGSPSSTTTHPI